MAVLLPADSGPVREIRLADPRSMRVRQYVGAATAVQLAGRTVLYVGEGFAHNKVVKRLSGDAITGDAVVVGDKSVARTLLAQDADRQEARAACRAVSDVTAAARCAELAVAREEWVRRAATRVKVSHPD